MLRFCRAKLKIVGLFVIAIIVANVLMYDFAYADINDWSLAGNIYIPQTNNQVLYSDYYNPKVKMITVAYSPNKTSYKINDFLDMAGLILQVSYDNGTVVNVVYNASNASEFSFNPTLSTPLNTSHVFVTITYGGSSASIPISVSRSVAEVDPTRTISSSTGNTRTGKVIDKNNQDSVYSPANSDAMNQYLLAVAIMQAQFQAQALAELEAQAQLQAQIQAQLQSQTQEVDPYASTYSISSDGSYIYPNGSIRDASGKIYNTDGTISLPDNSYIDTNGVTHYSDGSIKLADGTKYNIDGSIDFPNGTVLTESGRIIKRTRKAVETEEKEKNKAGWRYDPLTNEWHVDIDDQGSAYYK